jgi:hypothetical protein
MSMERSQRRKRVCVDVRAREAVQQRRRSNSDDTVAMDACACARVGGRACVSREREGEDVGRRTKSLLVRDE